MKKYYIKYRFYIAHVGIFCDIPFKAKYKTEKARDEGLKNFKLKGHLILEVG